MKSSKSVLIVSFLLLVQVGCSNQPKDPAYLSVDSRGDLKTVGATEAERKTERISRQAQTKPVEHPLEHTSAYKNALQHLDD